MWTVEFFDARVKADLERLPEDMIAQFLRISRMIREHGLGQIHEPYVKHLEGPLWEIRMRGRDGIARAAYVTAAYKTVIVVHVFRKKTQKTDRRDIDMAMKRSREIKK